MAKIKYEDSLEACYPEIAKEWHPTLNLPLTPKDVHNGSSTYVYWICPHGHTYRKTVGKRTKRGQGCPQCRIEERSFAVRHSELLKFWDYEKNTSIKPEEVFYGSEQKVWWTCSEGHSYEQKINSKSNGMGCPYCTHQKISLETCLATVCPDIAKEWHPTKNGKLTPYDVMPQAHRKVWWLCPRGHTYQTVIYARQRTGCPICDSEKRTSFPEQAMAFYFGKLFPIESRGNIGGFEADIYCPTHQIAIEYDGEYFHKGKENDAREERKNFFFIERNILLIRIKESKQPVSFSCAQTEYGYEISVTYSQEYDFVKDAIAEIIRIINTKYRKNYSVDVDIARDKVQIIELYAQLKDENSFLIQKPLGAQKWDYEKNGSMDLRLLPKTSKKKYWWKCPTCGNEWYGSLYNLVNSLTCNKCSRQVKTEYDIAPETLMDSSAIFRELPKSLQSENPDLASQWHPTKNGFFKPIHVTPKSGKRVWWLCPECGHEWAQIVKTRNNGKTARRCPVCANNQKKENTDSLNEFNPILYEEWHPIKNEGKQLTDYTPGSNVKVWWICSKCGNEYYCSIKTRKNGGGCTVCGLENASVAKYKKVRNIDTGEIFESVKSAAEKYGIHRTSVTNCLRGKSKTGGGYRWEYYKENSEKE